MVSVDRLPSTGAARPVRRGRRGSCAARRWGVQRQGLAVEQGEGGAQRGRPVDGAAARHGGDPGRGVRPGHGRARRLRGPARQSAEQGLHDGLARGVPDQPVGLPGGRGVRAHRRRTPPGPPVPGVPGPAPATAARWPRRPAPLPRAARRRGRSRQRRARQRRAMRLRGPAEPASAAPASGAGVGSWTRTSSRTARYRTRSPGRTSAGADRSRSHIRASVWPISCQPPGELARVDGGEVPGEATDPAGTDGARGGPARHLRAGSPSATR